MASVCYDCTLWYGHPLSWCPGCGRKMTKVKTSSDDFKKAQKLNWKFEGDKGLYEYYLDGKLLDPTTDHYRALYQRCYDLYPQAFGLLNLQRDTFIARRPTPQGVNWQHFDRYIKIYLEKPKCFKFYIESPIITFRLKGSDLPINEESFDYKYEPELKLEEPK